MTFREFLEAAGQPSNKSGLYPMGYGGIGLYPPQYFISRAADAITYITHDERIYKKKDGDGHPFSIKHIPGEKGKNV